MTLPAPTICAIRVEEHNDEATERGDKAYPEFDRDDMRLRQRTYSYPDYASAPTSGKVRSANL